MKKGQITAIIHENEKVVEIESSVTNCYISINDISFNENNKKFIKWCGVYNIPADTGELKIEDKSLKFNSLEEITDFLKRLKQISLSSNSKYYEKWV